MSNIGYARVSTDGQTCEGQIAELKSAGCVQIFTEHASGGDRSRSELAKALKAIQKGDTLIVYRIDRLARSLTHLLDVVEGLERKGASFRSLHDPIDTASPQGKFTLQMLGSVAEFERALIRERTKVGLLAARNQGRIGGNPGLRSRSPEVLASVQAARDVVRDEAVQSVADRIVPHIKEMRPREPWKNVAMALNVGGIKRHDGGTWDVGTVKRAASRLVKLGLLDPKVLRRASTATKVSNHVKLIVMAVKALDNPTLQAIAQHMERTECETPRGDKKWSTSSVQSLLSQAVAHGLLEDRPMPSGDEPRKRGRPPKSLRA